MARKGSGVGQGGKTYEERQQAARVRNLTLTGIEEGLTGKDKKFKQALILRLAGSILPRLNEHSGEDGGPIVLRWKA